MEERQLLSGLNLFAQHGGVDWKSAGIGGVGDANGGTGTIELTGISGTVQYAYLYWHGTDRFEDGADGLYDEPQVTVNGNAVTGQMIGTFAPPGSGVDFRAFRADVTSLVAGSGTYLLGGLADEGPGNDGNGASLVVIYDDGNASNDRNLAVYDGCLTNTSISPDGTFWKVSIPGFDYAGGSVRAQLHVSDGQEWWDPNLRFYTSSAPAAAVEFMDGLFTFDGMSVASAGDSREPVSSLWDIHSFDITAAFDNELAGPGTYELVMEQYADFWDEGDSISAVVLLVDNGPSPPLSLTIFQDQIMEQGPASTTDAFVSRPATSDLSQDVVVTLVSNDPGEVSLPASVTIPAWQDNAWFSIHAVDDTLLDGTEAVTITATAEGYLDATATMFVYDSESFSLSFDKTSLAVGGESTTVTLTRSNTDVESAITVQLSNSEPSELVVPTSVEIPAGQRSVTFQIHTTDNGVLDGTRPATISPSAPGYAGRNATIEIREEGMLNLPVLADGTAKDTNGDGVFDAVAEPDVQLAAKSGSLEQRWLMEFDLAGLGPSAVLQSASLAVSATAFGQGGITNIVEIYAYAGDGALSPADAMETATIIGTLNIVVGSTERHHAIVLDTSVLQTILDSAGHVGFYGRIVSGTQVNAYSSEASFIPISGRPTLHFVLSEPSVPLSAADDQVWIDGAAPVTIDVLANDAHAGGQSFSIVDCMPPGQGTVALNADGTFTYTPNADFDGQDQFTYILSDGRFLSRTAVVTVTDVVLNSPPVAADDSAATDEDAPITIAVLANDFDPDGDPLSAALVSGPSHGQLTLNGDGSFTYTPDADFSGTDSFTYQACDEFADSNIAMVTLTVNPLNDAPVAGDQNVATDEDTPLAGSLTASDADGDVLTFAAATGPANGSLIVNADGTYVYTPNANFHGSDSFSVAVSDGNGGTATTVVTVLVASVNDFPAAANDAATTDEDTAATIAVLANDSDIDGGLLRIAGATQGAHGAVTINGDETITYAPDADFHGSDSFTYAVSDGQGGTSTATVLVNVAPVNDDAVANPDAAATDEDAAVVIDVLANDADVDGDSLSISAITQGASGTVVVDTGGTLTYTPNANFHGTDSFTYTISDGIGGTATASVTLTVAAVNDVPAGADDAYSVGEDQVLNIGASGVLANDGDIDGDALAAVLAGGPANGTLTLNVDGSFTYTPNRDFNGTDSFSYRVSDGQDATFPASVIIIVAPDREEALDINPGDATNTIDLQRDSQVKVAILSRAGFNATTDVDLWSLTFGRSGFESSLVVHHRHGPRYDRTDVNGDGRLDLVVYFETGRTGLRPGDVEAILRGRLIDGSSFEGRQNVQVPGSTSMASAISAPPSETSEAEAAGTSLISTQPTSYESELERSLDRDGLDRLFAADLLLPEFKRTKRVP